MTMMIHFHSLPTPHRQCLVCSRLQHLQHHHVVDTSPSMRPSLLQLSPWPWLSSLSPSTSSHASSQQHVVWLVWLSTSPSHVWLSPSPLPSQLLHDVSRQPSNMKLTSCSTNH